MKFYALTYDDNTPTRQQVNIPTNSDYKVGIKVVSHMNEGNITQVGPLDSFVAKTIADDLHLQPSQVSLVADDGTTIPADSDIVNGYITFTFSAGDEASFKNYKVKVQNDTFSGVKSALAEGNNGNRMKQVGAQVTFESPIKLYPSDKVLINNKPNVCQAWVGHPAVPNFYSFWTINEGDEYYSTPNSLFLKDGQYVDYIELTQDDIDAGYGQVGYYISTRGAYHFTVDVVPYERVFELAVNVFKSQQGDMDAIGMTSVDWDDIKNKPDVLTPSSEIIEELDSTVSALSESFGELDSTVSELALSVGDVDAKVDELDSTVSALAGSLSSYATKTELSDYATTSAMEAYVSTATSSFITSSALTPYAKTSVVEATYATQSAVSSAIADKVVGNAVGAAPVVMSVTAIYETAWASISQSADPNTFYVVLPDPV